MYSDGLDMEKVKEIKAYVQGRIHDAYGIGTYLSNDVGVKPLNMVIKLAAAKPAGWTSFIPTVKLSDVEGKHTGTPEEIEAMPTNHKAVERTGTACVQNLATFTLRIISFNSMKNLIWLVLVMLFTSSCNKEEKEIKALKENGIYELKYLKEYAHDYSPDSLIVNTRHFNYLYNSLHLVNAKDSSVLFFTDYEEGFFAENTYGFNRNIQA